MRTTPLKAIFPKKLFKHLVVLAGLGNWLVNSINPPDKQEEVYLATYYYLLSFTCFYGLEEWMDYEEASDTYAQSIRLDEELQPFIDKYNDYHFQEELVLRLTHRDMRAKHQALLEEGKVKEYKRIWEEVEARYYRILAEEGVENLYFRDAV